MTDNWLRRHYEDEAINLTTYFGGRIQIVRGRYASTINGHLGPLGFGFGHAEPVHAGHCDVVFDGPPVRGRYYRLPRGLAISVVWGGNER